MDGEIRRAFGDRDAGRISDGELDKRVKEAESIFRQQERYANAKYGARPRGNVSEGK